MTVVTRVADFDSAAGVDPRETGARKCQKARTDGVSVSGLRAAPGLGLSSDSSTSAAVMGPGIGTFRSKLESELHLYDGSRFLRLRDFRQLPSDDLRCRAEQGRWALLARLT